MPPFQANSYSFLQDYNRCTRARCALLCNFLLLLILNKLLSNEFLRSITKISVSFTKLSQNSAPFSVVFLECISVNPLMRPVPSWKAICPKLSLARVYHLLINFVKYELLHQKLSLLKGL